jgi:hypothetical protein
MVTRGWVRKKALSRSAHPIVVTCGWVRENPERDGDGNNGNNGSYTNHPSCKPTGAAATPILLIIPIPPMHFRDFRERRGATGEGASLRGSMFL